MDAVTVEFQARRKACLIRFVAGLGAVAVAVVFCFFFVDRQIAGLLRPDFYGDPFFVALTFIAKPLAPAGAIVLALIATRNYLRGGSLTPREDEMLRLSLAIVVSAALAVQLKILFGRTWPETWVNNNPSWFVNGVYGFFPLTDSRGFASFPSGHTTIIAAFAGAVWRLWPKLRFVGVIATALVGIGLLGATYHWFSDIVAGAVLGFVTGLAAASIGKTQPNAS